MGSIIGKYLICIMPTYVDDDDDEDNGFPFDLNLNLEVDRLKTFNRKWRNKYVDKNMLARTGFYYLGVRDRVKCQFCHLGIECWMKGDNVIVEHLKWSPMCPLLRKHKTSNLTVEQTSSLEYLLDRIKTGESDSVL